MCLKYATVEIYPLLWLKFPWHQSPCVGSVHLLLDAEQLNDALQSPVQQREGDKGLGNRERKGERIRGLMWMSHSQSMAVKPRREGKMLLCWVWRSSCDQHRVNVGLSEFDNRIFSFHFTNLAATEGWFKIICKISSQFKWSIDSGLKCEKML